MTSERDPGAARQPAGVEVRELRPQECGAWLRFRELLWPDVPRAQLEAEQEAILADPATAGVLVAALPGGELLGFAEVSVRAWAEGCESRPVGYLEAWYVEPERRRAGVGRRLIAAVEGWARSRGCREMGSDAELENAVSRAAHRALGFEELGAVVLFRKGLAP